MNQILKVAFNVPSLHLKNLYRMGMLTDKLTQKQNKKAQQQFKKQIEHLANKPSFTYLDYKQRILDELVKLQSSFKSKMSEQSKQAEKALQMQKKIMSAMFQQELIGEKQVDVSVKQQIAIVSEVPLEKVKQTFKKAASYRKMHRFIRNLHLSGQPLPQSMGELQYQFRNSKFQFEGKQRLFLRYKQQRERGKNYMRAKRARYVKFHGK